MRLLMATANDIRYQAKYGFYFLYAFITVVYSAILYFLPDQHKSIGASLILLTDPATLGFFFVGGIWLLEKDEGIHRFYGISPLKPIEYLLAKALSLAMISTLSAFFIVRFSNPGSADYPLLLVSIFAGSCIFTLLGLTMATYSNSVNSYMVRGIPVGMVLILPPMLVAFHISRPALEILPGMILWQLIDLSIKGQVEPGSIVLLFGLMIWLGISTFIALLRVPSALQSEGGGKK
ncbi:hypothetical protein Desde_1609 [Desulfitobacterium dehalogenans ATCC 51507]|uniref:ABC transporter permease n=1 Tax=Desulfitobacterium dehalogenans (strain ATCC 51507 / DSM 9161 / JW/IU-DC1) TaxID=756499 RepID=I4A7S7_DESDJ|nr:hypothetical protein [Desulfitobacterium dehalogenans]AFM00012.1 hypothetical protein Desde_1609 [Desulfitobacterium dehalogenans ATCC 51507]